MTARMRIAGIVLLAAIIAGIFWYQRNEIPAEVVPSGSEQPAASHEADQESADLSRNQASSGSERRTARTASQTEPKVSAAVRQFMHAESALAAQLALDDLEVFEPELAAGRQHELFHLCNTAVIATRSASNDQIRTRLETFCAGFDAEAFADSAGSIDRRAIMRYGIELEERISSSLKSVPESGRSDAFEKLVRDAQLPGEVFELISQNVRYAHNNSGQKLWTAGQDIQPSRYPEANLLKAQEVALTLYICRKFGGCGSRQFFSMQYCLAFLSGRCRLGATLEDMLYQITPPADFNLAMELLVRL